MSDSSQGEGWWVASDGRWYPPEQHPDAGPARPAPAAPAAASTSVTPVAPAAPATPAGPVPDGAPHGRRRSPVLLIGVLAVAVLVVVVGVVVIGGGSADETSVAVASDADGSGPVPPGAGARVVLEPVGSPGSDPFTTAVAVREVAEFPSSVTAVIDQRNAGAATDASAGTLVATGTTPGLYGGTTDDERCDPVALADFLDADPAIAEAWAGALDGVAPDATRAYLEGLTPVVLTSDTRVTNHGLVDGVATPFQSVLQAGTAVLVDQRGVPVVRCSCGNPLAPPETVDLRTAELEGPAWDGFQPNRVVRVDPGVASTELTLVDTSNGTLVARRAGVSTGGDVELITTGVHAGTGEPRDDVGVRVAGQDFLLESPMEPLIAALTAELGPPTHDEIREVFVGCGIEEGDRVAMEGWRVAWGGLVIDGWPGGFLSSVTLTGPAMAPTFQVPWVTDDPTVTTDSGLGIGSTMADLVAAIPGYSERTGLSGMSVNFAEDDRGSITSIGLSKYLDTC